MDHRPAAGAEAGLGGFELPRGLQQVRERRVCGTRTGVRVLKTRFPLVPFGVLTCLPEVVAPVSFCVS